MLQVRYFSLPKVLQKSETVMLSDLYRCMFRPNDMEKLWAVSLIFRLSSRLTIEIESMKVSCTGKCIYKVPVKFYRCSLTCPLCSCAQNILSGKFMLLLPRTYQIFTGGQFENQAVRLTNGDCSGKSFKYHFVWSFCNNIVSNNILSSFQYSLVSKLMCLCVCKVSVWFIIRFLWSLVERNCS